MLVSKWQKFHVSLPSCCREILSCRPDEILWKLVVVMTDVAISPMSSHYELIVTSKLVPLYVILGRH